MFNYYGPSQIQKQQRTKQPNIAQIIYLGELPKDIDQYELDQFIRSKGNFDVESLTVKPTKENKSFAYVKFKNKSQAEEALKVLHLCSLKDHIIRTEAFKSKDKTDLPKDNSTNIFVKNLPLNTTSKELYDLFITFGNINSIKLKQKENNQCMGYGYVDFEKVEDAQNSIENLNDSIFKDNRIIVTNFLSKKKKTDDEKFPLVTVKNLPENLQDSNNLKEFLEKFGEINLCSVVFSSLNKNGGLDEDFNKLNLNNEQEKIGLALFDNKQNALKAIKELNGKILDSNLKPIYIALSPINKYVMEKLSKAKKDDFKQKYEFCNLVVKNLSKEIKDKNLYEMFRPFGDIKTARIAIEGVMKDKQDENGNIIDKEFVYESKGFGYVLYKDPKDALMAIESLNNKLMEYNGAKLKPIIEYYNYSKLNNPVEQKMNKQFRQNKPYQGAKNNNNNFYQNQNYNQGMKQYPKQNNTYQDNNNNKNRYQGNYNQNNRQFPQNQNDMLRPASALENPQINNQQFPNNPNINQQNMLKQPLNNNNNSNRYINNNNNPNQQNLNIPQKSNSNIEVTDFINNIKAILSMPHTDERTEQLGEIIFYFLHEFIPKYSLNIIPNFDDTVLCSKLTGILINEDDHEILEIVSNNETIIMFIKNVIVKLINQNEGAK